MWYYDCNKEKGGRINMAVKWIVTDMDGTLLDENDRITPITKKYLLECQKHGIKLILASGRSYSRLMSYAKELQMLEYEGYLIEVNGMALNRLKENERRIYDRLETEDIKELFEYLKFLEVEVQGYEDKGVYYWIPEWQKSVKEKERERRGLSDEYPWLGGAWTWVTDSTNGYPKQKQILSWKELPLTLNKFGCLSSPEHMKKVYERLKERYGEKYEIVRTCPRLIEIAPKGITKGKTLIRCMKSENISPEEVIVFGDGENDVDMFSKVKYSIAMGNAEEYVKAHAYMTTESNQNEGIAKALSCFIDFLPPVKEEINE